MAAMLTPLTIASAPVSRAWTDHVGASLALLFPPALSPSENAGVVALPTFVRRVVRRVGAPLPVVLVAHAYVTRLGLALRKTSSASAAGTGAVACAPDTPHRAFLAALLVAAKVAGDDPVRLPASGGSSTSVASSVASTGLQSAATACAATLAAAASAPSHLHEPIDVCLAPQYTARDVLAAERALCKALQYRMWVSDATLRESVEQACADVPQLARAGGDALLRALEMVKAQQGEAWCA